MPQETKAHGPASTSTIAGASAAADGGDGAAPHAHAAVAGWKVDLGDPAMAMEALEKAFDYRGDVTLTLRDGSAVSGYLYDRSKGTVGGGLGDSKVRIMPADGSPRRTIAYDQIAHLAFSDRDPAAGKSFETWIKKYVEKKLAGEKASIESEELE